MSKSIEILKVNEEKLENNLSEACNLIESSNRAFWKLIYIGIAICIMTLFLLFVIEHSIRLYIFIISFIVVTLTLILQAYKSLDLRLYKVELKDYKKRLFDKLDLNGKSQTTISALINAYDNYIAKCLVYLDKCNLSLNRSDKVVKINRGLLVFLVVIYTLFFWMERSFT